jgi:hypothetical protein
VEDDVVGHVADPVAELVEAGADRSPDRHQVLGGAVVQLRAVRAGDDEHLVGDRTPERADDHHPVVGVDDPVPDALFGVDRGAQEAAAGEAGEAGLLLGELARHEGHAEQLAVGMLE